MAYTTYTTYTTYTIEYHEYLCITSLKLVQTLKQKPTAWHTIPDLDHRISWLARWLQSPFRWASRKTKHPILESIPTKAHDVWIIFGLGSSVSCFEDGPKQSHEKRWLTNPPASYNHLHSEISTNGMQLLQLSSFPAQVSDKRSIISLSYTKIPDILYGSEG